MIKRALYPIFRLITRIGRWRERRLTPAGLFVTAAMFAGAAIGMDTNYTLIYQAVVLLFLLILAASIGLLFVHAPVAGRRTLPKYGTVGMPLPYTISIRNVSKRVQLDLMLMEDQPDPRPTRKQFMETPEPGESKRNAFDRAAGFYRFRWLTRRNMRADCANISLPPISGSGKIEQLHQLKIGRAHV